MEIGYAKENVENFFRLVGIPMQPEKLNGSKGYIADIGYLAGQLLIAETLIYSGKPRHIEGARKDVDALRTLYNVMQKHIPGLIKGHEKTMVNTFGGPIDSTSVVGSAISNLGYRLNALERALNTDNGNINKTNHQNIGEKPKITGNTCKGNVGYI